MKISFKTIVKSLPLMAAVLSVGLAIASTSYSKEKGQKYDTYTFQYTGDFSQSSVQSIASWHFVSTPPGCSGSDMACSLTVPEEYVDNTGTEPVLKSTINIQATQGSTGNYRVSGTAAGGGATISNQSDL